MKELIEAIDLGWDVEFTNQIKRLDGDFCLRVCYKAVNLNVINDPSSYADKLESEWEGFETAKEAVNDFIEKINPKLKK